MSQKIDKSICWNCRMRPVEYKVSVTGKPLNHGICRDCYESKAAWAQRLRDIPKHDTAEET